MKSRSGIRWGRWTAQGIAGVLLLLGSAALAVAADEVQATNGPSAASSSTAATSTATTQTSASAPKVVCLQNSIRCFPVKATASSATARPALDLSAPDIHRVFSAAELQQTLQDPDEAMVYQETVEVEGKRVVTPVSVGIMALPWAVLHPTQAWRIFMPLPSAK